MRGNRKICALVKITVTGLNVRIGMIKLAIFPRESGDSRPAEQPMNESASRDKSRKQ